MTVFAFAFYLFAIAAVVAGLMVVVSKNPVHSVLWLILAFLSASGLFVLIGVIMLLQLGVAFGDWVPSENAEALRSAPTPEGVENTAALGMLLYDKYLYLFQAAGLILLVAMIGAIVLTLRHRKDVKRQNVIAQMHRDPAKAMEMVDVKPGQGL